MAVQWNADWPELTLRVGFSGSSPDIDITSYVRECYIDRPPSRETGRYPAGTMTVTLDNRDGRFSPFNLSGPYTSGGATQILPDLQIRLSAVWNATTYYLFCGYTENWQDEYPDQGTDAVTVLTCVDPLALLSSINRVADVSQGEGELSHDRIFRIISALPVPSSVSTTGDNMLQATTLEGNALEECYRVADSEGGAFWYEPVASYGTLGAYRFESRSALLTQSRSNTSQVTFGTGGIAVREFTTSSGRDQILRTASYANVGGSLQTSGSGQPARVRTDLLNVSDTDAMAVAQLATAVGDPAKAARVTSVTINPVISPSAMWPHALGRRIRDRATVNVTIPASSLTINKDVFIDGISHAITPLEWSTTFQFASAEAWDGFAASVFDTAVFDTDLFFY